MQCTGACTLLLVSAEGRRLRFQVWASTANALGTKCLEAGLSGSQRSGQTGRSMLRVSDYNIISHAIAYAISAVPAGQTLLFRSLTSGLMHPGGAL